MKKIKLLEVILILIFCFTTLIAQLKVGPSHVEISLDSGKSVTKEIYLENTSDKPMDIVVFVKNYKNSNVNKDVNWDKWLKIRSKNVKLKPHEKRLVKYQLKAYKNFEGEVSAKVSFINQGGAGTSIRTKMSIAVYLISKNNSKIGAELGDIQIGEMDNSIRLAVPIKNTASIHIRPIGVFFIYNSDNKLVETLKCEPTYPIFEGNKTVLKSQLPIKKPVNGTYKIKADVSLGYNDVYKVKKEYRMVINKKNIKVKEIK